MSALELVAVQKSCGAVNTLKGIDISLENGEFLVLLGPSGCGKSTLLSIIAGLVEPTAGDVRIDGRSVVRVHPKDRDIAMVFQSYAHPNLSVARNIGFGLEMRKVPADKRAAAVKRAAEMLQIEPLLDRKPSELSGGQRQRVAIGRALVRNPKVFLFDEPLSNLDAKLRMETRTELKRLHQSLGTTIIYVTHDQVEAMTLATRIAIMRDGRIEQLDTPEKIYERPANLYVAGFMGAPPMNALAAKVDGDKAVIDGTKAALPISVAIRSKLVQGQDVVIGIRPERLASASEAAQISISAVVDVVELTGPEKLVVCRIGQQSIIASLEPQIAIEPGMPLCLAVAEADIRWFDAATGVAIG
jgi:multiple sugar transport system ATP-binding protein